MKLFIFAMLAFSSLTGVADDISRVLGKPTWVYIYLDTENAGEDPKAWFGTLNNPAKTPIVVGAPQTPLFPANDRVVGQLTGLKNLVDPNKDFAVLHCPLFYYPVPMAEQKVWVVYNIEVSKCR